MVRLRRNTKNTEKMSEQAAPEGQFDVERDLGNLFTRAVAARASDIHFVPWKGGFDVRYRLDGRLETQTSVKCPDATKDRMVAKIKVLGELRVDETRLPQDGRISANIGGKETHMRISTLPTVHGEKVVVRILGSVSDLTADKLGFAPDALAKIKRFLDDSFGLMLVVGATGSGKSTTLQALLSQLDREALSVSTLEDPVEYQIPNVSHSQVNHKAGFDFASGLRSLLRQDPDVIMVGEIRDHETAKLCTEAAVTGHLVFSTIHANTAAGTVQRLLSLEVDPHMVISGLKCVAAQCLGKRLCPACREKYAPDEGTRLKIRTALGRLAPADRDFMLWRPKEGGCGECGGRGTRGRVGFYEVMEMTEGIRKLVGENAAENRIEQELRGSGVASVFQDALLKAVAGTVSLEEVALATGKTL